MPDFFIAGVPKAGTTALHVALGRHPALYMSAVKEPKFFLTEGSPPARGGPGDAKTYREHIWRRADYEALFDPASADQLRGESTPFYLHSRDAQRRIRAQIPNARLIVLPGVGHMVQNAATDLVIREIEAIIGQTEHRTAATAN